MTPGDRGSSREEPNRFLGFPVATRRPGHEPRQENEPRHDREEPQRVMGMPVTWFGSDEPGPLAQAFRRWVQRRRGPHGTDGVQP
jgi:hypothetical protein